MKRVSLAIPLYNEEENIARTYKSVCQLAENLTERYEFEFVFTDNRSTDKSFEILKELANDDSRVKVLRFSRNFGYQKSLLSGFFLATGDAVIQLDCDLEDPPEMVIEFLDHWEQGSEVVYGIRKGRFEPWYKTVQRKIFYRFIDAISETPLPHDAGDFRLLDRKVVEALKQIKDSTPYIRGSVASIGFRQKGIEYHRNPRVAGESKFTYGANLSLALDGILNHSVLPLRIAAVMGGLLTLLSIVTACGYFILKLTETTEMPVGFTTIVLLQLFAIGINALFLGVIGEYLGRIYKQSKSGPVTILDLTCNVSEEQSRSLRQWLSTR